jgi:4-amino-4-deoxy-L-arabinose transferase-like glycosyltransferase
MALSSAARAGSIGVSSLQPETPRALTLRSATLICLAIALPICLLLLAATEVISMEGIVALGARHMNRSGDWLVPRLYGEIYAFKPPLSYWLVAVMDRLGGGLNEFTLRLPTALCGLLLGLLLVRTMGAWVSPRCGLACGLAGISTGLFIGQVAVAGFEMPVALGVGAAVLAACRNLAAPRADWRWWMLGYAGLLVAFLSKGLPPLVTYFPGLITAAVALKRIRSLLDGRHVAGVVLFASCAAIFLWMSYQAEGVAAFEQHLGEIAFRSSQWTPRRLLEMLIKPVLIAGILTPWSIVLLVWPFVPKPVAPQEMSARIGKAAWWFLIWGVVSFMAVPTDSSRYYLVLVTPLAILCGLGIERMPDPHPRRALVLLTTIGLVIWVITSGFTQPHRAKSRSLRAVAETFRPLVPPDATILVDTQDSYSSLFFYLDRDVKRWQPRDDRPRKGDYAVLCDSVASPYIMPRGMDLQVISEVEARDGHRYSLCRIIAEP